MGREKNVCILMYHQVGEFAPMRTHRPTYCHVRNFRKQMAYLHRLRYPVLSLAEALTGLRGERELPDRAVALTFDDGYMNYAEHAAPVMERYGFPSTVFLLSGKTGGRADWLLADGHPAPPLLDEAAIHRLQGSGTTFASHGRTHRRLSTLSPEEVCDEIAESKAELEAQLGEPVRSFCYPYGDYTPAAVDAVKAAGYEAAVTCIRGRATPKDSPYELPRMAVSFGMSLPGFVWKIHRQRETVR